MMTTRTFQMDTHTKVMMARLTSIRTACTSGFELVQKRKHIHVHNRTLNRTHERIPAKPSQIESHRG